MSEDNVDFLQNVADEDVRFLIEREALYKGSWKKSGGRSAYFMLVRKIDRIQNIMSQKPTTIEEAIAQHDIFEKIKEDPSGKDATLLSEVRDLRRYLLLVESEMIAKGFVSKSFRQEKDDESIHAKQSNVDNEGFQRLGGEARWGNSILEIPTNTVF